MSNEYTQELYETLSGKRRDIQTLMYQLEFCEDVEITQDVNSLSNSELLVLIIRLINFRGCNDWKLAAEDEEKLK